MEQLTAGTVGVITQVEFECFDSGRGLETQAALSRLQITLQWNRRCLRWYLAQFLANLQLIAYESHRSCIAVAEHRLDGFMQFSHTRHRQIAQSRQRIAKTYRLDNAGR